MKKSLILTTAGSFPRDMYKDNNIEQAIQSSIQLQRNAKMDLFVDGQFRNSIVGIFSNGLGLHGNKIPYTVTKKVEPQQGSITFPDLELAASFLKEKEKLKAHITGAVVIAESTEPRGDITEIYQHNKNGFRTLVLDTADALAYEAYILGQNAEQLKLGALQIDEPTFSYGADLVLGHEALKRITDAWKKSAGNNRPTLLHVCGDFTRIWDDLLDMPVDILSIESMYIENLTSEQIKRFKKSGKKLALGCISVNSGDIPDKIQVAQDILLASERVGEMNLWGLTLECGLRESDIQLAENRLQRLYDVYAILPKIFLESD